MSAETRAISDGKGGRVVDLVDLVDLHSTQYTVRSSGFRGFRGFRASLHAFFILRRPRRQRMKESEDLQMISKNTYILCFGSVIDVCIHSYITHMYST